MKLRNKKTGEIVEVLTDSICVDVLRDRENITGYYNSLVELNAEWEDYEEPKEYWYICSTRNYEITMVTIDEGTDFGRVQKDKEIGNYFETYEQAEKAVEKLKAWKRLKEKGFKFVDDGVGLHRLRYSYDGEWCLLAEDFNLLFGGEE